MIVIRNLNKKFGKVKAVKDLNLQVEQGTIHGLIGPQASGKSTVLRILSTLVRPDSGEVIINNIPLRRGSEIRSTIGFVPETPHLPPDSTVREIVTFAASLHGIRDKSTINNTLKQTGLDAVADRSLQHYPDTMEKNVAFAMAFVHNPQVLLLDEPMTGIDPVTQKKLTDFLLSSKKTVLLTAQDLDAVEGLCSSVTVMRNGSAVVDGEMALIRQKIGKGTLEIKLLSPDQAQKLLFELEKYGANARVSGESVYVDFKDNSEVPVIVRTAAAAVDVLEVKPVKLSIDDIFAEVK